MVKKLQKENFRFPYYNEKDGLFTGKEIVASADNIETYVYNQEGKTKTSLNSCMHFQGSTDIDF